MESGTFVGGSGNPAYELSSTGDRSVGKRPEISVAPKEVLIYLADEETTRVQAFAADYRFGDPQGQMDNIRL